MGFFKTMLKMNTCCYGKVSGSEFSGCYVGPAKKEGQLALEIYGAALKNNYIFTKNDIAEITSMGNGIEKNAKGAMTSVSKYLIKFKDGKTGIFAIDQGGSFHGNFENRVF